MMEKSLSDIIENKLTLHENSIWMLPDQKKFGYSDGAVSEKYLRKVFLTAGDLSSNSFELENWIRDWPSEYHLSRKRAQLLRGFEFKKSQKVLEVGCGCGSITRFLGETFENVLAIEGSKSRAELARLRTKDMENVSIICAPFQKIRFKVSFDFIFCIGVFEYSNMFVEADDAYDHILKYFKNILSANGVLIIAIENQFGLKYFSSSKEDHTNKMFDGLEGYPAFGDKRARTFGYHEIHDLLGRYFQSIEFYYPYPDYKTPSCILSDRFLRNARAGELIGKFGSSPHLTRKNPLFDDRLVLLELDRNNMLPFFTNSFLIVAGKQDASPVRFNNLGLIYSNNRVEEFQTVSRLLESKDGIIRVDKGPANGKEITASPFISLHKCQSEWINGLSVSTRILKRVKEKGLTLKDIFSPAEAWIKTVRTLVIRENDRLLLDGKYIDCLWSNSFIDNGKCIFVDLEWELHERVSINVLMIRCLYVFLNEISSMRDLNPELQLNSSRRLMKRIAGNFGFKLRKKDFNEFCVTEARIYHSVSGGKYYKHLLTAKLILWNRGLYTLMTSVLAVVKKGKRKIENMQIRFGLDY